MKKIIILIAMLCCFSFSSDLIVVNGVIYGKSRAEYSVEDTVWTLFGAASGSCANKINGKPYYDYDYNSETREIVVWRSCEGTLLFKGKVTSQCDGSLVKYVSTPSSDFDGFCYDKNGMNPIKHVNQFTKCR